MSLLENAPGTDVVAADDVPGEALSADDAWVAGYEMGQLDAQLAVRRVRETVGLTIRAVNREAAAAVADRHGYELVVGDAGEPGFVWVRFRPLA